MSAGLLGGGRVRTEFGQQPTWPRPFTQAPGNSLQPWIRHRPSDGSVWPGSLSAGCSRLYFSPCPLLSLPKVRIVRNLLDPSFDFVQVRAPSLMEKTRIARTRPSCFIPGRLLVGTPWQSRHRHRSRRPGHQVPGMAAVRPISPAKRYNGVSACFLDMTGAVVMG